LVLEKILFFFANWVIYLNEFYLKTVCNSELMVKVSTRGILKGKIREFSEIPSTIIILGIRLLINYSLRRSRA